MNNLDLFSGFGGFALGLQRAGFKTVTFCEIESYPQKVLKKHWPDVPIASDIKKLTYKNGVLYSDGKSIYRGTIDLVCGGFPCQPFSQAGKRDGFKDDRDLWPEMFRVIQEVRPRWVIGENVAGFINMGLDRTLSDLEGAGYRTEQVIIPACSINAPHRRDRIWIVGHSSSARGGNKRNRQNGMDGNLLEASRRKEGPNKIEGPSSNVSNPDRIYAQGFVEKRNVKKNGKIPGERSFGLQYRTRQWEVEPDVGRVAHGIPSRVDRLKGLGNAVVPQIPEILGKFIMEIEKNTLTDKSKGLY